MSRLREVTRGGFTLIEVMVTLVILEVAVVGVAGLLVLASQTIDRARLLELALAAAVPVADSLLRADSIIAGRDRGGQFDLVWDAVGSETFIRVGRGAADTVLTLRFPQARP